MKKITGITWAYASIFLIKAILFNIALGFSIAAVVVAINDDESSLSIWAIIAIATAASWISLLIVNHVIWSKMSKDERALYLAIRKHGKKIVEITESEVGASGQHDIHEVLTDTDNGLEIQMIINGTGTFINVFIGTKWFAHARKFNANDNSFHYNITKKEISE